MCFVYPRHGDWRSRLVDDDYVTNFSIIKDCVYKIVRRLGETEMNPLVCEIKNTNKILTPCFLCQTLRSPNLC